MKKLALISALGLCGALGMFAQNDRGTISGTVKDPSGAVVADAQVAVVDVATNATSKSKTTPAGDFTVPSLPVGTYEVTVENAGFKRAVRNNVILAGGDDQRLNFVLEIGAAQQSIEISADAQLLQVDSSRVATDVSTRLVEDLPTVVNGGVRSPFDLAGITADVSGGGNGDFRIGGGRAGSFGITLDGVSSGVGATSSEVSFGVINQPSVEALTEFNVESAGFKAESGHASGGTVSFVSKSGTNAYHGNLYEFLRNQDLDARGFFGATKPVYKQNDFGGTFGGPVLIPHVYHGRNKTFFFVSYEGFRNRVGATVTPLSVPPSEFFGGNLQNFVNTSNKQIPIYDPGNQAFTNGVYSRPQFANNVIPPSRIDPVAMAIMKYVQPLIPANVPATAGTSAYVRNNFLSTGTTLAPNNKTSVKIDQTITSKQRMSAYFAHTNQIDGIGANGPTGLPAPLSGNPGFNKSNVYRISHDYTISPTLFNRFYAGGNDWEQNHGSLATSAGASQAQGLQTTPIKWGVDKGICIPNYPDCNADFPQINFGGEFTTWGVAAPNGSDNIVVEFRDDLTKVHGTHTFKGGYFYNTTHYNGFGEQNIAGNTTYNINGTSIPQSTNQATGGGSAFASFLLGYVSGWAMDTPRYLATNYVTHQMFVQDDWRVSGNLTLNLGLRYEINMAPFEGKNLLSDFSPSTPNPGAGGLLGATVFACCGKGTENNRRIAPNAYGNVGPHLGLSWSANSKTTIRAAASRTFGPIAAEAASSSHFLGYIVRTTSSDQSLGLNPQFYLKNGPPAPPSLPDLDPSVGNGLNAPYYNGDTATKSSKEMNYSFDIQRQITPTFVIDAGYIGTMASDIQSALLALNQINYSNLPANLSPFTASGRTILGSLVGSTAANAAGITAPFSGFNSLWGNAATVAQSLRPYPQFSTIDTATGGGDRLGHSTYNSLEAKFTKRSARGFTLQGSYTFSKLLTDADSGGGEPENNYNRSLEKSIASYDQTHSFKVNYVYELPFGSGHSLLPNGVSAAVLGGWRVSASQSYSSGTPIAIGTTQTFPIFNGGNRLTVSTYDGWRGTYTGNFDPNADSFFQPVSFFGPQSTTALGNATRFNPKLRNMAILNENISVARSFKMNKERQSLEFRMESFNVLNRTTFGPLSNANTLQNTNFGKYQVQANSPRRMQASLKFTF